MKRSLLLAGMLLALLVSAGSGFSQSAPASSPFAGLMAQVRESDAYEGADLVLVFDSTRVDVDSTGLSHKRMHTLTQILTPAGISKLRAVRLDYDPASNKIELGTARIHRKDGRVEEIPQDALLDLPQPTHLIYWGARMKVVPVAPAEPLEVGDAVEMEHTMTGFMIAYLASDGDEERYIPPMRGTYYDVVMFGSNVLEQPTPPIRLKSYTITMPRDKPAQFETYNGEVHAGVTFADDRLVYHFWKENVPAYEEEPRAPGPADFVPKVVFTNVQSWAEKSRWFYHVNEDRDIFGADAEIEREVARVTKGCKTDSCKYYALLHWVAQNIRYSGISMGEGEGYTLHPSTMTFRDRAGVCKDIAGMLVTMLRVAGFTTYPVMTMAGARVEQIPADQFNHCVVAVRRPDGSFLMLDPTWSPFNTELWSNAESEQHYVVGSPEGEDLAQIPKFTSEDNDLTLALQTKLDADGNLTGTVKMHGLRQGDARLRRPFSDNGRDRWDEIVRGWLTKADPAAELVSVKYGDLWDFYKPFTVEYDFRVPHYARVTGKRMDYVPFASRLLWAGGAQMNIMPDLKSKEREQPVFTYNPRQVTLKETLALPAGFAARKLPDPRKQGGEIAWIKGDWKAGKGTIEYSQVWHVRDRWVPAAKYDEVKAATDPLKAHDELKVVLAKEGGRK